MNAQYTNTSTWASSGSSSSSYPSSRSNGDKISIRWLIPLLLFFCLLSVYGTLFISAQVGMKMNPDMDRRGLYALRQQEYQGKSQSLYQGEQSQLKFVEVDSAGKAKESSFILLERGGVAKEGEVLLGSSGKAESNGLTVTDGSAPPKRLDPSEFGVHALPECPFLREGHETYRRDNRSATARVLEGQLELLEELISLTEGQYYLTYGTLIGAVRHGGLIPWDYDMDVSIIPKASHGWEDMYKQMKTYLQTHNETCRGLTRVGDLSYKAYNEPDLFVTWFDPYYWKNHSEYHPPVMRLHYLHPDEDRDEASGHTWHKMCFGDQIDLFLEERSVNQHPLNQYGPLCRCYFNGVPTRCLANSTGFLSEIVGDWQTPEDQFGIMTAEAVQDRGFCDYILDELMTENPRCIAPTLGQASQMAIQGKVKWDDNGQWQPQDLIAIGHTLPPTRATQPTARTAATTAPASDEFEEEFEYYSVEDGDSVEAEW